MSVVLKKKDITGHQIKGIYKISRSQDSSRIPYDPCLIALDNGVVFELRTALVRKSRTIRSRELPSKNLWPLDAQGISLCLGTTILDVVDCPEWVSIGLYLDNGLLFFTVGMGHKTARDGYVAFRNVERMATYPMLPGIETFWERIAMVDAHVLEDCTIQRERLSRDDVVSHRIVDVLQPEPIPELGLISNPVYVRIDNGILVDTIIYTDHDESRYIHHAYAGDMELKSIPLSEAEDCRGEAIEEIVSLKKCYGGLALSSGRILTRNPYYPEICSPVCEFEDLVQKDWKIRDLEAEQILTQIGGRAIPTFKWPQEEQIRRDAGMRILNRDDLVGKKMAGFYAVKYPGPFALFIELEDGTAFQLSILDKDSTEPIYAINLKKHYVEPVTGVSFSLIVGQTVTAIMAPRHKMSMEILLSNKLVLSLHEFGVDLSVCISSMEPTDFWNHRPIEECLVVKSRKAERSDLIGRQIIGAYEQEGLYCPDGYHREMFLQLDTGEFVQVRVIELEWEPSPKIRIYDPSYRSTGIELQQALFLKDHPDCLGMTIVDVLLHPRKGKMAFILGENAALIAEFKDVKKGHSYCYEESFTFIDLKKRGKIMKEYVLFGVL